MRKPKIALDLDGVVVNFHQKLIDIYNDRYPDKPLTTSDIDCDIESLGPELARQLITIFNEDGFLLNLEPFPGAINTISQFQDLGFKVTVCTAPARNLDGYVNPNSAAEKFAWLRKQLPFWAVNAIITKNKKVVGADMLIDDTAKNIISWCDEHTDGIGYLINQPWNQKFRHYPSNSIRGSLPGVASFIEKFWCPERGKFFYRLEEFHQGWK